MWSTYLFYDADKIRKEPKTYSNTDEIYVKLYFMLKLYYS